MDTIFCILNMKYFGVEGFFCFKMKLELSFRSCDLIFSGATSQN